MQKSENNKSEIELKNPASTEPPFGANDIRLNVRQWLTVLMIVLVFSTLAPVIWKRIEDFDAGVDYRIPYSLSSDYWLYQRRVEKINDSSIPVIGDSVVWGEYVRPNGTLTHFLNLESGKAEQFVNCGVNGLFPLSLEGLVSSYASSLRNRKVIVQCNILWMSSPKADLSTDKEETFNHSSLVPQFSPNIPCYRADASVRLGSVFTRNIAFFGWVGHVDGVYFNQQSIPLWTLEKEGDDPPRSPNVWRNPFAQITFKVPGEPSNDPLRGPESPRHKAWNSGGSAPTSFDWVSLESSLQWHAFQRTVTLLKDRGKDVMVILGPFNKSMVAKDQRPTMNNIESGISQWLTTNSVSHIVPETLPANLYADASHPLTDGYALLAKRIAQDPIFQAWMLK